MNMRISIIALLIGLIGVLLNSPTGSAGEPGYVTILYNSDDLGYLVPCG